MRRCFPAMPEVSHAWLDKSESFGIRSIDAIQEGVRRFSSRIRRPDNMIEDQEKVWKDT